MISTPSQQSDSPIDELANEQLRMVIHRHPQCRIEFDVKTAPTLIGQARKAAIKAVGKEISIPGFRKGKAPEFLIVQKYSHELERQFQKALANLTFVEAQKLSQITPLNHNSPVSFDLKEKTDQGAHLTFSFEIEPTIPHPDSSLFTPKIPEKKEVGDVQIDEAIHQMRFFFAEWKEVQDRPIQEKDYILIDLETIEGDQVQPVFQKVRFEVSKERMADWMQKLVLGAHSGDVLNGVSEPDDTLSEEEKKEFSPKNIRLHVLKVEEAALPELDENFLKKVGSPDFVQLRSQIQQMLESQIQKKADEELREQANQFLVSQYPFELPQSLIDSERKHRLTQALEDPEFQASWQKFSPEERKKEEQVMEEKAVQAIRLFYLSRQIVQDAKISLTHQEIQDEAIRLMQTQTEQQPPSTDAIPKEIYALALSRLILGKAQDLLIKAIGNT